MIQKIVFVSMILASSLCVSLGNVRGRAAGGSRRDGAKGGDIAVRISKRDGDNNSNRDGALRHSSSSSSSKFDGADLAQRIKRIEEENRKIRTNNSVLTYEVEDLKKTNVNLKDENSRFKGDSQKYQAAIKEVDALQRKVSESEALVAQYRNQLLKISEGEKETARLVAKIAELEREIEELRSTAHTLNQTIEALKQKIAHLETQVQVVAELKIRITELTHTIATRDSSIAALQNQLTEAQDTIKRLQHEIAGLQQSLEEEITHGGRIRGEIRDANALINNLNKEIIELKKIYAGKDGEIKGWADKVKALQQQLDALNVTLKNLQPQIADRDDLIKRLEELKNKIRALRRKAGMHGSHSDSSRKSKSRKATTIFVGSEAA